MNANDRNESEIRQRDAKLARRLGEALDQLNPQGAGDCPDAEVIAAYAEKALGADGVAQCENHFASCARCRNILNVLSAGLDTPLAENEVARLGQRVSAVRVPVAIDAGSAKRPRTKAANWGTRWLAPAFGVAAVLAIWFVMRPPWRAMDRSGSATLVAQAPQQEIPGNGPSIIENQEQKTAPEPRVPSAKSGAANLSPQLPRDENLKQENEIRQKSPNAGVAEDRPAEKKKSAETAAENKTKSLEMPSVPPVPVQAQGNISSRMNLPVPSPQARAQADSAATAAPDTPRSTNQSVMVTESAPTVETTNSSLSATVQQQTTELPVNGRNFQALNQLRSVRGTPVLVKSPTASSFWRIGVGGVIERTSDAGKTWAPQISPSREEWLAGSAVSDTLCWIAGRNGAIARTTDGENWQSVTPPPQGAGNHGKFPDWTGITAGNSQSATITAANGNKFATTDGGKTWKQ